MVVIRRIKAGEGKKLRDIRLRALETDPLAFGSSYAEEKVRGSDRWDSRAIEASVGDNQFLAIAAEEEFFIGMAGSYRPVDAPDLRWLYGMWVAPRHRSSGLGTGLVEAIIDWCGDVGCSDLRLWVVETNLSAVRLYRRTGFVETGTTQWLPSNPSLVELEMSLTSFAR